MKPTRLAYITLLVATACASTSCGGVRFWAPNNPIESSGLIDQVTAHLKQHALPSLVQQYNRAKTSDEAARRRARNQVIDGLILLIDNEYEYFATRMLGMRAGINTTLDTTAAGLALAATIVDHGDTSDLLSGIGAGMLGLRTTIDKEFYYDQSTPILFAQMNKDRERQFEKIQAGVAKDTSQYSMTSAIRDLGMYYQAGTLFNAFAELSKSVNSGPTSASTNAVPRMTAKVTGTGAGRELEVSFTNKSLQGRTINLRAIGYEDEAGTKFAWSQLSTVTLGEDGKATAKFSITFAKEGEGKTATRIDLTAPTSTPLVFKVPAASSDKPPAPAPQPEQDQERDFE